MMESDGIENSGRLANTTDVGVDGHSSVNNLILDYYKKFGRKRDLEQYFSLSTAQGDLKDPGGIFWRKMKSENDSSESEGKKSDSSHEVCRISIRCSVPDPCSSQDENTNTKTESESPPIVIEEVPMDTRQTDEESIKSDDNNSQQSYDVLLDTSAHKPLSPTSSITSQRKLEWDSLADVGYANESDRKNSASSLSTLERLALKQQYSNNDTNQDIGLPTSHSTPLDENDNKSKIRKGVPKKTTKFYKKDVDFVEVNVPHSSDANPAQSINVNLTKHISFNVERDGGVTIDHLKKDISISPEKTSADTVNPQVGIDREIQTTLTKTIDKSTTPISSPKAVLGTRKIPVMISLNTLRKRIRRKRTKSTRRRSRGRRLTSTDKSLPLEKSAQLSEAESFEYMPGHMYNQNLNANDPKPNTSAGNKSSLESSGAITDSSKGSKHSFTKDLEKSIELLKVTLQQRFDDSDVKNKLIKEVVARLLNSRYRDDDSTADFLSGLTFSSRRLGLRDSNQTTSTSDANNTDDSKIKRPKKSILRTDKFNANVVASTSQSAPNLLTATSSEKAPTSNLVKATLTTDSDVSSRKSSSDNVFPKTSSEELYLKYLEALRREQAYKKHLKEKEMFLKQKLVSSDTVFKVPARQDAIINSRLKDLMKDLTRNNYDDGSGDASKLEGGSNPVDFDGYNAARRQRSHSVFTLSSSHSEGKKPNAKKNQCDVRDLAEAGTSRSSTHYCCPQHYTKSKVGYTDSSVQVNIECQYAESGNNKSKTSAIKECRDCQQSPRNMGHVVSDDAGDIKYVCLCNEKPLAGRDMGDNFLLYKCSRLTNKGVQLESASSTSNTGVQCNGDTLPSRVRTEDVKLIRPPCKLSDDETASSDNIPCGRKQSKSSQTNLLVKMPCQAASETVTCISDSKTSKGDPYMSTKCVFSSDCGKNVIREATRCLQTEISINPKISDPSLTDINLVNDCECVKLVDERCREVSVPGSKISDSSRRTRDTNICTSIESGKSSLKNEVKCCSDVRDLEKVATNSQCAEMLTDEYQIPIQGTNMTLMVTLGSLGGKGNVEKVNQACVTDKATILEQATSIRDECSKSVQCEHTNISTFKKSDRSCAIDHDSCKVKDTATQSCAAGQELPTQSGYIEKPKSNTFPKKSPVKKSLCRSNTDTETIENNCCGKNDFNAQRVRYADQITNTTLKTRASDDDNTSGSSIHKSNTVASKNSPRSDSSGKNDTVSCGKKDIGVQNDSPPQTKANPVTTSKYVEYATETQTKDENNTAKIRNDCNTNQNESPKSSSDTDKTHKGTNSDNPKNTYAPETTAQEDTEEMKDPILDMIKDITKRYSKNDIEKMKRKRCFKEIMTVLNYLLETDDSTDQGKRSYGSCSDTKSSSTAKPQERTAESRNQKNTDKNTSGSCFSPKKQDRKASGPRSPNKPDKNATSPRKNKISTGSSDMPASSNLPTTTSSDSATCKVLNKIKKECDKYHQKRCKAGKKCEASSSTSVNCDQCKKVHHCFCRGHKCKRSKTSVEKFQKKCIAYNLIIQTSESMISEETTCDKKFRPLQNIVVKVPKKKVVDNVCKETSCKKETEYKVEKPRCSPRCASKNRSRSCPNESEMSSTEELVKKTQQCTVREYLERNRPDFVENCCQRQNCLKFVSEIRNQASCPSPRLKMVVVHQPNCMAAAATNTMYCEGLPMCYSNSGCNPCNNMCNQSIDPCEVARIANERVTKRELLSMHLERQPDLTALSADQLRQIARDIGVDLRRRKPAPKFISEKEMKKHSEKIYKTLPEVVQKKEELKKENIKKTNLLMANIFKKNLQKKTLRGSVNLSNYNTVIKI